MRRLIFGERGQVEVVGGAILLIVAAAVVLLLLSWTQVSYGTVGVITRFGAVADYNPETGTGKTFHPGLHFRMPFVEGVISYRTQKITYETSEHPDQSKANYTDYEVDTTTADGQQIKVRYTVRFSVDPMRAAWIAQNLGTESEVVEKVIKTDSRIHVRNIARQFPAADLYTGDVELYQTAVDARLRPIFAANGLIIDEVGIRSIVFTADYIEAVEQKQIAYEGITTARYQAEQETHRKQAAITQAEARAETRRIEADADAYAINVRGTSLRANPEIIQYEFVTRISPNIKVILLPSGQEFILGEGILGKLE